MQRSLRRNDRLHQTIQRIITRPPSAELRADQKDQDSLPPYDVLDAILAVRPFALA
jgi:NAD+ synthase (glutamine-hydrolysing)